MGKTNVDINDCPVVIGVTVDVYAGHQERGRGLPEPGGLWERG